MSEKDLRKTLTQLRNLSAEIERVALMSAQGQFDFDELGRAFLESC